MNHKQSSDSQSGSFIYGKNGKIDWKKVAVVLLIVAIAGYRWYSETANPPQENGDGGTAVVKKQDPKFSDDDYNITFDPEKDLGDPNFSKSENPKSKSNRPYLLPGKGKNLESPEGLVYTSGREHRRDHVLLHAKDNPSRAGPHGVFHANGDEVFELIDEAYLMVKNGSRKVKTKPQSQGKTEYVIDMGREVGYLGGQKGKRQNYPKLYQIKLILAENRVITAFPF
ncbi:MAG: hypothetical protein AAF939_18030 [Planctomycetota bacterium]